MVKACRDLARFLKFNQHSLATQLKTTITENLGLPYTVKRCSITYQWCQTSTRLAILEAHTEGSHTRLHNKEKQALKYSKPGQRWNVGITRLKSLWTLLEETDYQLWSDLVEV